MGMPESAKQYDPGYLLEMSGGDADFIEEILSTFLETAPDLLAGIEVAANQGDVTKAIYATHTLKGSARSVGAEPIGFLCEQLEQLAKTGDMGGFADLSKQVPEAFDALRAEMNHFLRARAA
jgi:HPt (histidine-containing phosphotransfer) domain-containing protein